LPGDKQCRSGMDEGEQLGRCLYFLDSGATEDGECTVLIQSSSSSSSGRPLNTASTLQIETASSSEKLVYLLHHIAPHPRKL
jgi:hypothetical protein